MSFAAPAVEAVAADAGATSAGTAAAARGASRSIPAGTAAQRAQKLVDSGMSRTRARRTLRDEYGATAAQADDLLDATTAPPAPPAADAQPDTSSTDTARRGGTGVSVPKPVRGAMNAGGGAVLGALLYVLGLVYLRGGTAGLKAWYRAKFLNDTGVAPSATAATPGVGNNGSGLTTPSQGGIGQAGGGVASSGGGGW